MSPIKAFKISNDDKNQTTNSSFKQKFMSIFKTSKSSIQDNAEEFVFPFLKINIMNKYGNRFISGLDKEQETSTSSINNVSLYDLMKMTNDELTGQRFLISSGSESESVEGNKPFDKIL